MSSGVTRRSGGGPWRAAALVALALFAAFFFLGEWSSGSPEGAPGPSLGPTSTAPRALTGDLAAYLDAALAPIAALRLARTPGPRIIDPRRIGVGPRESSGCIATGARGRARPHRLHRRTRRLPGPQGHAPTSLSRPPSTPHTEAAPRLRRPPRPQGVHDVSPARFGVRGVDRSRRCRARSPRREPRWST